MVKLDVPIVLLSPLNIMPGLHNINLATFRRNAVYTRYL